MACQKLYPIGGTPPPENCCPSASKDVVCPTLTVYNKSSESISLKPSASASAPPNGTFAAGSETTIILTPAVKGYGFYGDSSGKLYSLIPTASIVTLGVTEDRTPLTKSKRFIFWLVMPLLLIAIIIATVMIHKNTQIAISEYCEKADLDPEECAQTIALGNAEYSVKGKGAFIFIIVICSLLFAFFFVCWFFAFGPLKWASYGDCSSRVGFNKNWFWVQPRKGWRNFLCRFFGACECAADSLATNCNVMGETNQRGWQWDEEAAAKSTSKTAANFCCFEGVCKDPIA